MAGICGIIGEEKGPLKEIINNMLELLKHRGNKYRSIYSENDLIMGFQGAEERGYFRGEFVCLLIDGIIYNGDELKKFISMENNDNANDEVILSLLYEKYGIGMLRFLNGDFVILIWDIHVSKLYMAKSLVNNKNMYYYQNKALIFASEIKAILAYPAIKKEVDIISLNNFLTFRHIPSPHTFFKDIKRLNAGSVLSYDYKNRILKEEDIGYISIKDSSNNLSEKDILVALWQKLNDSIGIRIKKAKKAGLFLSGGIDSSALLYFLSQHTKDIKTYTAGGLEGDLLFSRKVSNFFHIENIGVDISAKNVFDISPKALWFSELPFCGPDAFQYLLSKSAEKERFMFWGQGSEEIFFGRHDYVILDKLERIKDIFPLVLLRILNKRLRGVPNESRICKLLNVYCSRDDYDTYVSMRETFTERERESVLNRQYFLGNNASLERIHVTNGVHLGKNLLRNYSFLVLKNGYLSDVFPAMGYELMNPYMDKNLLNFLYTLPNKIKIKNNRIRYLLSKMMTSNLPAYIIKRRKEYWNAQTIDWVKSNMDILYLYIKRLKKRGYIRNSLKIEDYFQLGKFGAENKLWSLFTLELLHEIFIDRTYVDEPPALTNFIAA